MFSNPRGYDKLRKLLSENSSDGGKEWGGWGEGRRGSLFEGERGRSGRVGK